MGKIRDNIQWILVFLIALFGAAYVLQAVSPLRLNTDAYRLLSMAVSAHEGHGYLVDGKVDQFPVGYPSVIRFMLFLGLANPASLIVLNLACLSAGLAVTATWNAGQRLPVAPRLGALLVLGSWITVKHVTLPQSEMLYFATSLLALMFASRFWENSQPDRWIALLIAAAFAAASILTRTVGLTLVPVLALCIVFHRNHRRLLSQLMCSKRVYLAVVPGAVVLLIGGWLLVRNTQWYHIQFVERGGYLQLLSSVMRDQSPLEFVVGNIHNRLLEFGEILLNLPLTQLPGAKLVFLLAGLICWILVLYGAWRMRRDPTVAPLLFTFFSYVLLLLVWPAYDPRFWLPMLPLVAHFLMQGAIVLVEWRPGMRYVFVAYLAGYLTIGIAALAYSSYISFSGREYSETCSDVAYRMTYRRAFQNGLPVEEAAVMKGHLHLLQVFDPRAALPDAEGSSR